MSSFSPFRERPDHHQTEGYNQSGSTIVAGSLVSLYGALSPAGAEVQLMTGIDDKFYGVVRGDIPAGQWGTIQNGGRAIVKAGVAGFTAGDRLMAEAGGTGCAVTWSAGAGSNASLIGIAEQTATSGNYAEVALSAPGVSRQG